MTDTAHQRNSTLATKLQKISGQTPPHHDKFHKLTHSRPGLPAALHFHDTAASTTQKSMKQTVITATPTPAQKGKKQALTNTMRSFCAHRNAPERTHLNYISMNVSNLQTPNAPLLTITVPDSLPTPHLHDTVASTTAAFSVILCRSGKKEWREERKERREGLQILLGDGAWSCENTGRDAGGFRHSDI